MVCGSVDAIWQSCDFANAIVTRLRARHSTYRHVLLEYPDHLAARPGIHPLHLVIAKTSEARIKSAAILIVHA